MDAVDDEDLLLAVLNTTPIDGGQQRDELQGDAGAAWLAEQGVPCSTEERENLIAARDLLQDKVRGVPAADGPERFLHEVAVVPVLEEGTLVWERRLPLGRTLAARIVLAWAELERERPDRLRACANPACRRFLIDRSRSNQAKWCSMATCGNRAKARRHYERKHRPSE